MCFCRREREDERDSACKLLSISPRKKSLNSFLFLHTDAIPPAFILVASLNKVDALSLDGSTSFTVYEGKKSENVTVKGNHMMDD